MPVARSCTSSIMCSKGKKEGIVEASAVVIQRRVFGFHGGFWCWLVGFCFFFSPAVNLFSFELVF